MEHGTKNTDGGVPSLASERAKAIVLLLVQLYALAQTGLTLAGVSQLPFTSDEVSAAITGLLAVASSVWSWWRNNNLTQEAVDGTRMTHALKKREDGGVA